MAFTVLTFSSSQAFMFTGSSLGGGDNAPVTASVSCWGAGGHGDMTGNIMGSMRGNGGSGGAFATKMVVLTPGQYFVEVGIPTDSDGGSSSFSNGDTILVSAAGGRIDGTNQHQRDSSIGSTIHVGGRGGNGHEHSLGGNGGGGGGCGGPMGDGEDGQPGANSTSTSPARGGRYNNSGVDRYGGHGAFYYAGAGTNGIVDAAAGNIPGCGGGGGYGYPTNRDSSNSGGRGVVQIYIDSEFA